MKIYSSKDSNDNNNNGIYFEVVCVTKSLFWCDTLCYDSYCTCIELKLLFHVIPYCHALCRSLLNISISKDCCSSLKSGITSILTSLCRLHPPWFSVAVTTVTSLFEKLPLPESGRVLQTLADCSLSEECINVLLMSPLLNDIIQKLTSTVETVLKNISTIDTKSTESALNTESNTGSTLNIVSNTESNTESSLGDSFIGDIRSSLVSICSMVAFLTDIVFGHRAAQECLVTRGDPFLPLLMKLCNIVQGIIPHNESQFIQHTVQQYLSVCSKFSLTGKQQFVNLLLNALQGKYSLEPFAVAELGFLSLKITPFLRTLIIDHVLGPEAVHLLLEIDESLLPQTPSTSDSSGSGSGKIKLDSIMPSHDCPHYHPSYPIESNYYYLKLSSEFTLFRLLSLLTAPSEKNANTEKTTEERGGGGGGGAKGSSSTSKKPLQINIFNFNVVTPSEPIGLKSQTFAFKKERGEEIYPLNTKIRQVSPSVLYGCSHSRSLRVCGVDSSSYSSDHLVCLLDESESLLRVFADSGGLYLLAQLFPYVHPGLWAMGVGPFEPTVSACLSRLPSYSPAGFLSPHSYVMLGLCMKLKEYSKLLGETGLRTYVWYLLRGVLGATEEGKENFLNLFLIFWNFFSPSFFLPLPLSLLSFSSPSLSPSPSPSSSFLFL